MILIKFSTANPFSTNSNIVPLARSKDHSQILIIETVHKRTGRTNQDFNAVDIFGADLNVSLSKFFLKSYALSQSYALVAESQLAQQVHFTLCFSFSQCFCYTMRSPYNKFSTVIALHKLKRHFYEPKFLMYSTIGSRCKALSCTTDEYATRLQDATY